VIDLELARQRFVELLQDQPATLYATTTESLISPPAIIVGQPTVTFSTLSTGYGRLDTSSFPIMVLVRRPGSNDPHQQHELEELWPSVAETLAVALIDDQTLGGLCKAGSVIRADFSFYVVQGKQYPTQTITVELYG